MLKTYAQMQKDKLRTMNERVRDLSRLQQQELERLTLLQQHSDSIHPPQNASSVLFYQNAVAMKASVEQVIEVQTQRVVNTAHDLHLQQDAAAKQRAYYLALNTLLEKRKPAKSRED